MKKTAIIWRKSVYDNNFICKCGEELMHGEEIKDTVLFDTRTNTLICPKCKLNVAIIADKPVEVADDDTEYKRGYWTGNLN